MKSTSLLLWCSIVLLFFFCTIINFSSPVESVVVRRRVVSRPPEGELDLPPFNAQPFVNDAVYFSWTIRLDNVTREWILAGRFNFTKNAWFGIGLQSPKRMDGPLVICYIDQSEGLLEAKCDDYYRGETVGRPEMTFSARTVATDADVSDTDDGYIVFDTRVQLANESDDQAMIARDRFSRVIFARGLWDSANKRPQQHDSEEVAAMLINFDSGEVQKFEANSHILTFYVLAAAVPISAIVGFIDTNRHFPRNPKNLRLYLSLFGLACCLGLLIMYFVLRYNDYIARVAGKAVWRALGDACTFILSCMILPVSKRGLFHDGYGVSHEKAIKYHMMQAGLLIILALFHMAAWIKFYSFDWIVRWAEKDRRSHLPGLLAFITMLVVVGPALMRQRNWRMFRFTHYGVVFIYFFAVLHFPPLAYGVAPSFLLHLAATAITRYRESYDFHQSIEAAYYDEHAGIVTIDILRSAPVRPGKYFMLRLPELNSGEIHPFSIAKMIPIGSNADPGLCQHRASQLSTAGVDDTDDWLLHPPLSGQLTSDLVGGDSAAGLLGQASSTSNATQQQNSDKNNNAKAAAPTTTVAEDPTRKQQEDWTILRLMIKVSRDKNSWTYRLSQYLKQKQIQQKNWGGEMVPLPFSNFRISGPYGRLEVNPAVYCQFVFVAGGMGINPLLYTLQCMSMGMIEYTGDPLGYLSINFYWVVREEATYESYIQDLLYAKKRLEKLCPACSVYIRVTITGKNSNNIQQQNHEFGSPFGRQNGDDMSMMTMMDTYNNKNNKNDPLKNHREGDHFPAVLEQDSQKLLDKAIVTERTPGRRPDFLEVARDAINRCRNAAADPRHIIAAEDTTPEREALLREAVAVSVCAPSEMTDAVMVGFKAAEDETKVAVGGAGTMGGFDQQQLQQDEQPINLHFETYRYQI